MCGSATTAAVRSYVLCGERQRCLAALTPMVYVRYNLRWLLIMSN